MNEPNETNSPGARLVVCNVFDIPLSAEVAHCGRGEVMASRILDRAGIFGGCNFIDYAEIPVGAAIGNHRHNADEEEFYLFLDGTGLMRLDDREFEVHAGDLVRNKPGGLHGLRNNGTKAIKLFVFELTVRKDHYLAR